MTDMWLVQREWVIRRNRPGMDRKVPSTAMICQRCCFRAGSGGSSGDCAGVEVGGGLGAGGSDDDSVGVQAGAGAGGQQVGSKGVVLEREQVAAATVHTLQVEREQAAAAMTMTPCCLA